MRSYIEMTLFSILGKGAMLITLRLSIFFLCTIIIILIWGAVECCLLDAEMEPETSELRTTCGGRFDHIASDRARDASNDLLEDHYSKSDSCLRIVMECTALTKQILVNNADNQIIRGIVSCPLSQRKWYVIYPSSRDRSKLVSILNVWDLARTFSNRVLCMYIRRYEISSFEIERRQTLT
jgi:hypothetical protein